VRITTVRYVCNQDGNFSIKQFIMSRALGVIAQYIDSDDKADIVNYLRCC
jgi:hypothetical protein